MKPGITQGLSLLSEIRIITFHVHAIFASMGNSNASDYSNPWALVYDEKLRFSKQADRFVSGNGVF